jgi:hypothetical protein
MNPTRASNPMPVSQRSVWSVKIFVIIYPHIISLERLL